RARETILYEFTIDHEAYAKQSDDLDARDTHTESNGKLGNQGVRSIADEVRVSSRGGKVPNYIDEVHDLRKV
ncbi:hypothetical protein B0H10DRAFT_1990447, partial [Mycena sp. CBHHK59/15]